MKKYRTWYDLKIEEIEVIRETAKYVVIAAGRRGERRDAKRSDHTNYFDTWEEARQFLAETARREIADLEEKLVATKKELDVIEAMQEPGA